MVDFKKRLGKIKIEKKVNPIEIYDSLDRRSEAGPLRAAQESILNEWFGKQADSRDLIIKLHTGEGKTLIGLLILQAKINSEQSPSLYVCPNKYLAQQVIHEAEKFGIPYCSFSGVGMIPNDFTDGKKILITHVQKVFNGKTVFGLDNKSTKVGSVVLDDSHACVDAIKNSFTISFDKDHKMYNYFINIFEEDIKDQGEGSFADIKNGDYNTMLPISYWSWFEKKSEILKKLAEHKDDDELKFGWSFIKDNIDNYQALITGNKIEISPYHIPIHHFGSFDKASRRILMSATTQDDAFFIKGLGFNIEAVKNPIVNYEQKWSGEKMILIPSLIHDTLNRDWVVNLFAKKNSLSFGVVFLVDSFKKAEQHKIIGSSVADTYDIYTQVINLKARNFGTPVVFVNRYDGIDLPDESCRILIIDSRPFFDSLSDKYEENCKADSDLINIKIAQKIEQGLGRSVRGEKDYSVIIIIGDDLVRFIKGSKTNSYFSDQTRKQVEIGLDLAEMSKEDLFEDGKEPHQVMKELINQALQRNEDWKAFYTKEMDEMKINSRSLNIYQRLTIEYIAEEANYSKNYEVACENLQKLLDDHEMDSCEEGWHLQTLARYKYFLTGILHIANSML